MAQRWLFLATPGPKPWKGSTIYTQPLGGSETAVIYTALSLQKKGCEVTVMSPGDGGESIYEGVRYVPHDQTWFDHVMKEEWHTVVSSRWWECLAPGAPWQTKYRFLWLHDMPYQPPVAPSVDKVVCISNFQSRAWGFHPDESAIIGNGVDLSLFNQSAQPNRNPNKVIWTSNPDRGLPIACKIFQEIRKRWPDLELHVYGRSSVYGWPAANEQPFLPRPWELENVFMHDPLTKRALAQELLSSWAWFYPTFWPETYCISALEAQAAGTPIISVPWGALPETVEGGILSYDFLNSFSQIRNKRRWDKLSEAGVACAADKDWSNRADQWLEIAS